MTGVISKQELVDALRATGERVVSALEGISDEELERGRYENGWNGRQIVAHLASVEWTYPRLLDMARDAAPERAAAPRPAGGSPQILSYNDRQVQQREGVRVAELITEFKKNRAVTIAAAEAADDALLTKEVTSVGGTSGPVANVFNFVAVEHVLGHLADITGETV